MPGKFKFVFAIPLLLAGMQADDLQAAQDAPAADLKRVEEAIAKGVEYLKKAGPAEKVGAMLQVQSSDELVLLTFLGAGVPESTPEFQKCLSNILTAPLHNVYQVSLQAMALEELDRVKYQGRIWQCAQFLVDAQFSDGLWSYGERTAVPEPPPGVPTKAAATAGRSDGSDPLPKKKKPPVTRKLPVRKTRDGIGVREHVNNSSAMYAALGLRACHDAGIVIPREVVERAIKWWRGHQVVVKKEVGEGTTGGVSERIAWTYSLSLPGDPPLPKVPTLSMTTGAVGSLVVLDYMLGVDWKKDKAVNGGINWIADHFSSAENVGAAEVWGNTKTFRYYYLYALERLGVLYDTPLIGTHRWYEEGAPVLLGEQKPDGSWNEVGTWLGNTGQSQPVWDTCFAILFLKRATPPLRDVASTDRYIKPSEDPPKK
jgi:hypothetical protein